MSLVCGKTPSESKDASSRISEMVVECGLDSSVLEETSCRTVELSVGCGGAPSVSEDAPCRASGVLVEDRFQSGESADSVSDDAACRTSEVPAAIGELVSELSANFSFTDTELAEFEGGDVMVKTPRLDVGFNGTAC
jgi:hypothetical protein